MTSRITKASEMTEIAIKLTELGMWSDARDTWARVSMLLESAYLLNECDANTHLRNMLVMDSLCEQAIETYYA